MHSDYTNRGYDRGHLAPNYLIASRHGRQAQLETFLLSNISPQRAEFNRIIWKELEEKIAREYAQEYPEIWVITGPIYYKERFDRFLSNNLSNKIEIPDAFFKIVFSSTESKNNRYRVLAFLIEQKYVYDPSFKSYLTSVDQIEELSKFDFFSELEDRQEKTLESKTATKIW